MSLSKDTASRQPATTNRAIANDSTAAALSLPAVALFPHQGNEPVNAKEPFPAKPASSNPVQLKFQAGVVQRVLEFTKTSEVYSEEMPFFMKYGMGPYEKGVMELVKTISAEITDKKTETYQYEDIEDFFKKKGYEQKEALVEEDPSLPFTVQMIAGTIGDLGVSVKENDVLKGIPSSAKSSYPLYEVMLEGKKFMLKKEPIDKSEFMGMEEMAKQGIKVPNALWLMIEGKGGWVLMDFILHLGPGMASMNRLDKDTMAKSAFGLGKMHIADIQMANVDRLPWRGNRYSGHLNNVFTSLLTGEIIGIDSEHMIDMTTEMELDIHAEMKEIESDAFAYAEKIYGIISTKMDANKLNLGNIEVKTAFVENFAIGLSDGSKLYKED